MAFISPMDRVICMDVVLTSTGFGVRKTWDRVFAQPVLIR